MGVQFPGKKCYVTLEWPPTVSVAVFAVDYYINNIPGGGCLKCDCNQDGVTGKICDPVTGKCDCLGGNTGFGGRRCDQCVTLYYGTPPRYAAVSVVSLSETSSVSLIHSLQIYFQYCHIIMNIWKRRMLKEYNL